MDLSNKNVVVTGADGFIGSHLVEKLTRIGANVTAFCQYNSNNTWGWIDSCALDVRSSIKVISGDIREYDSVKKLVKGNDVVFHLAALIAIPYSYSSPMAYVRTNVEGTVNVLEACREFDVSKVIHTSTSETYGSALYVPIDEKHPLQGQSPYSASKIAADKMAESYYTSYGLPLTTIRPFNTYGPRQSARAIIPTVISQIAAKNYPVKVGNLTPTREFNYVLDTVSAFIKVAECDATIGHVLNAGSNFEISIKDLIEKIFYLMDEDVDIEVDTNRYRPVKSEVNRLWADNKKITEMTGWRPEYDLDTGITHTISWIRENIHYFKTDIYNV